MTASSHFLSAIGAAMTSRSSVRSAISALRSAIGRSASLMD